MRSTGRAIVWVVMLGLVLPAGAAYRDLAACPDLVPLDPGPRVGRGAARCQRAVDRAARRYVTRALTSAQACLARLQAGGLAGDPEPTCVGDVALSRGERVLPTDAETAERIVAAEDELAATIARRCPDVTAALLPRGCAETAAGLGACVLADHREHVRHLLDVQFGAAGALTARRVRACQRAIAAAGRTFVGHALRAQARCLAGAARPGPARRCLGSVEAGAVVPPAEPRTAAGLRRAEGRLIRRVAAACTDEALRALDACAADAGALGRCLVCAHRREAILLLQGAWGGTPQRPTTGFIDWAALRNPVLGLEDRALKDQAVALRDGWFHVFASQRFEPTDPERDTRPRWFFRSRDFRAWEVLTDPDPLPSGREAPGSPDVSEVDGIWHMTFQARPEGDSDPDAREIFLSTSPDLLDWTPPRRITAGLAVHPIIDGALAQEAGFFFLVFKDRVEQVPYVARSAAATLDGTWLPPARVIAGSTDPTLGFAENFQLLRVDGVWRAVATGRDPERLRCGNPVYAIYTCSHEPYVYTVRGAGAELGSWTQWTHRTRLRIPYEDWNRVMHANTGFLSDWRARDGFFYLSYAGSGDGDRFELRGHGKLGLARSRDLVHWRVPGDPRD